VLTTAADDDARSATLLGADEDEGPAEDAEENDDSDAVNPSECLALDPVEV
jgi:hypothetical protein